MQKELRKISFIIVLLSLPMFIFLACRKNTSLDSFNSNTFIAESKSHIANLVKQEEALLSLPYSQLKKNANLRRFARTKKISNIAQWDEAKLFSHNGINYSIIPVNDDVHHLQNPTIESIRFLLFSKRDGDKMEMNIIEIYSRENGSLGKNLTSNLETIVDNILFKGNSIVEELTASVIVYDHFYYNIGSYSIHNGVWAKAKIVVENTNKRPEFIGITTSATKGTNSKNNLQKNLLSSVSPMSGCLGCTTYYLIGIWYDMNTGEIISTTILDTWDECSGNNSTPQGGAPGSTTITNNNSNTTKTVTNNITVPCISALLSAMTSRIANFAAIATNNENIYRPMNFNYIGSRSMASGDNGGLFAMYEDANGVLNFDIAINENTLPSAAQEYILRTFLHEALHGVLLSNGVSWDNLIQHDAIANSYRSLLANMLLEAFPNLNPGDAEALAWEGLGASSAWNNLPQWRKDEIADILEQYRNRTPGGPGTGC